VLARFPDVRTAKVKVADRRDSLGEDLERLAAVRDALGPDGFVRCDANAAWDVETAIAAIPQLDKAAGGLQYVEQPCRIDRRVDLRRRQTRMAKQFLQRPQVRTPCQQVRREAVTQRVGRQRIRQAQPPPRRRNGAAH